MRSKYLRIVDAIISLRLRIPGFALTGAHAPV